MPDITYWMQDWLCWVCLSPLRFPVRVKTTSLNKYLPAMTTILVAANFLANAHWATDYALQLASQLTARLVVIHS